MRRLLAFAAAAWLVVSAVPAVAVDWNSVDQALGKPGSDQPGGVHKYALPRSDLQVSVDGVVIKPSLALGGWLAFLPMGERTMIMGDLVLTEQEINPVLTKLLAEGITVTAIHNHLLRAQPAVFYMHVAAEGDPVKLAGRLHEALLASRTPLGLAPVAHSPASVEAPLDLDTAKLDQIVGRKGSRNGGVYQFSVPRSDVIAEGGVAIPPAMGTAIGINFQPTGGGKAAITGDFVLEASEVEPVLAALREAGIEVTALHNHMLDDRPRTFFVHFWANDDALKLARGIRSALGTVNVLKR